MAVYFSYTTEIRRIASTGTVADYKFEKLTIGNVTVGEDEGAVSNIAVFEYDGYLDGKIIYKNYVETIEEIQLLTPDDLLLEAVEQANFAFPEKSMIDNFRIVFNNGFQDQRGIQSAYPTPGTSPFTLNLFIVTQNINIPGGSGLLSLNGAFVFILNARPGFSLTSAWPFITGSKLAEQNGSLEFLPPEQPFYAFFADVLDDDGVVKSCVEKISAQTTLNIPSTQQYVLPITLSNARASWSFTVTVNLIVTN